MERKKRNLSLREASSILNISHSYLNKLEKNLDPYTKTTNKPTPATLKLIAKGYQLDYHNLLAICGYIEEKTIRLFIEEEYASIIKEAKEKNISPDILKKLIDLYLGVK